jgi:hypothetical protein
MIAASADEGVRVLTPTVVEWGQGLAGCERLGCPLTYPPLFDRLLVRGLALVGDRDANHSEAA